ncbi:hypothetical protein AB0D14_43850, partial [Streptomyces sp. NPDC048484]|uniref:hypothetical protein n=1 Tax=Streptomyces sp. NPDC048484 TaxID=3155146 RepID=UPI00343F2F66
KPCAGEPHARIEVAGAGNGASCAAAPAPDPTRLENLQDWNYDGTSIHMNDSISSHQWTNLP